MVGPERRLVTIVFADIQGFTTLSERLDPEVVADAMDLCLSRLAAEVVRFEGYVDKVIGDEIMALFGAPTAHDDDAVRAVRAAMAMHRAMEGMASELQRRLGEQLQVRIGIASGTVLAGLMGPDERRTYTVIGDAVNLAKRLQEEAAPGTTLVSRSTYRQASWAFRWSLAKALRVKGKRQSVLGFEVACETEPPRHRGPETFQTPFVGQVKELRQLQDLWQRTCDVASSLASLIGEPGSGKSRLASEFVDRLQRGPDRPLVLVGSAALGGEAYGPVLQMLRSLLEPAAQEREPQPPTPEATEPDKGLDGPPILRGLLEGGSSRQGTAPNEQVLFRLIGDVFEERCRDRPTLLIFEDLHWADVATLGLADYLLRRLQNLPVMTIALHRPVAGRVLLRSKGRHTIIDVQPLSFEESCDLVDGAVRNPEFSDEVRQLVVRKGQGNPLLLKELLRSLVERGAIVRLANRWACVQAVSEIEVPDSLSGVILERVDRLPEEPGRLLQEAAVIGQAFQTRLLKAISSVEGSLGPHLRELEKADLIQQLPQLAEGKAYEFKNELIREVLYDRLPRRHRAQLHRRVAEETERLQGDNLPQVAEALAHHYEQAGEKEKAARYHLLAGDRAEQVKAERHAQHHRRVAVELLGLASIWTLYAPGSKPSRRKRILSLAAQFMLAVLFAAPIFAFLMAQRPPASQVTLGLPLDIINLTPSAVVLAVLFGSVPLLAASLVFMHLAAPAYLRESPSLRRQVSYVLGGWGAGLLATTSLLAALASALRFDILDRTSSFFIGVATLQLLRGDVEIVLVIVLATLLLSLVWNGWLRLEAAGWRKRLLSAPQAHPEDHRMGAVRATAQQLTLALSVAAALTLVLLLLYVFRILPGTEDRPEVNRTLLVSILMSIAGLGMAAFVVRLLSRGGRPASGVRPRTLGFEVPLVFALLFGAALAFTLRQEVVVVSNGLDNPAELASLNRTIAVLPDLALARYLRGERYFFRGDIDAAMADFDKAIALDPDLAPPYYSRGKILASQGRYLSAMFDATRLIELRPEHPAGYELRASAHLGMGNLDLAQEDLERALQPLPQSTTAWDAFFVRCLALKASGRIEEAIDDCRQSLELNDKHLSSYQQLGWLYFMAGHYEEALATYDRLAEYAPENPSVLTSRGSTYRQLGRYESALLDLNKAVQLDPSLSTAYRERALVRLFLAQPRLALTDAQRAIALKRLEPSNYLTHAYVALYVGEYDVVVVDMDKALELAPNMASLYNMRGYAYALQGEHDRALTDLNRAVQMKPDSPYVYDSRGYAFFRAGNYGAALADLNRAVELLPSTDGTSLAEFLYHRALVYEAVGQRVSALADLRAAVGLRTVPSVAQQIKSTLSRLEETV